MNGFVNIPLSSLRFAEWNYKSQDKELQGKLRENIKRNGQIENLLVRELPEGLYEVVNGNHRLSVLKDLKFESAICCNLGKISDADAYRIAVETNETKFSTDPEKLTALLQDIVLEFDVDEILLTLPYDEDELNLLLDGQLELENVSESEYEPPEDMPACESDDEETYRCPRCKHEWSGQPR